MPKEELENYDDLWLEYSVDKSLDMRNKILLHYIYLVKQVANRMYAQYGRYVEFDDLIGYGTLGLIDAINRFDLNKEARFETYAVFRIKGTIIDKLRQQDWVPRSLRQKSKNIEKAANHLELINGKPPTQQELAQHLSVSVGKLNKIMGDLQGCIILPLEEQVIDIIDNRSSTLDSGNKPEDIVAINEVKDALTDAVETLNEREKKIISLYYFDELNLKEIGEVLSISESRVSQLHTRTLMKLRNKLLDLKDVLFS